MSEELLQLFTIKGGRDGKASVVMKASVGYEDMAVRMKREGKIPKGLHGHNHTRNRVFIRTRRLQKSLEAFPRASTQVREKFPIIQKIPTKNLGET